MGMGMGMSLGFYAASHWRVGGISLLTFCYSMACAG